MDPITALLPTTPAEPPVGEYTFKDHSNPITGRSIQLIAAYPNGFGASVVQSKYTYGGDAGLYEVAVLHGETQQLCYATEVTSDVIGHLTEEQVVITLHAIARLGRKDLCNHGRTPWDWSNYGQGR